MTLVWAPGYNGITDPDAQTYIAAVEAADGQAIEGDVALAINDFVVGCKLDGIWDAIKASCILAGARTLSGALVPLKGTAPTNNNFVSGDYNRETGLVGDASTKHLDSNKSVLTTNNHICVYATSASTSAYTCYMGINDGSRVLQLFRNASFALLVDNGVPIVPFDYPINTTGFIGTSRDNATTYVARANSINITRTIAPIQFTRDLFVFARNDNSGPIAPANARLSFYSIGESLDLEKLDNRTARLMNLISYSLASGLPDLSTMDLDAASYIGGAYRAGGTLS